LLALAFILFKYFADYKSGITTEFGVIDPADIGFTIEYGRPGKQGGRYCTPRFIVPVSPAASSHYYLNHRIIRMLCVPTGD